MSDLTRVIGKVLVANRGEIALRVMKTCRKLGLSTVAVFSDADADAPHVRFADEAVRLGPGPSKDSYLNINAVLRAAGLTGADAVHPGYGFLAENADFAEACEKAGLNFVGPPSHAIRAMGQKREAKALVATRGVPLTPGSDGGDQTPATLKRLALEVGLPVIFKPSSGGGGKGMKLVRQPGELDEAIASGKREAQSAFGSSTLIIEKLLDRPRHVEVQVLADAHGTVLHLFERECSIQRRHQKIVEETPSTALTPQMREAMCKAAVEAARAVGYVNAGTVEFLVDKSGFYFSEMNTRLQVEHRVTELVTGLDLVEQQLRVARGEKLAFTQAEVRSKGAAVECRLYAEDPAKDFLPCTGKVLAWEVPELGQVVVDSGVVAGSEISIHYDPMLAKLVAWGETRADANARMVRLLERLAVQGVTTNRGFLKRLLQHPEYEAGRLHTGFISEHLSAALAEPGDAERETLAAIAATLVGHAERRKHATLPQVPSGWRNNRSRDQSIEFEVQGEVLPLRYQALEGERFFVRAGGEDQTWQLVSWSAPWVVVQDEDGVRHRCCVTQDGDGLFVDTPHGSVQLKQVPRFPPPPDAALKGGFIAAMPGKVVKVNVKAGDQVKKGQVLLVLEAMKMEQATASPVDGAIAEVLVREGEQVTSGQILVRMKE